MCLVSWCFGGVGDGGIVAAQDAATVASSGYGASGIIRLRGLVVVTLVGGHGSPLSYPSLPLRLHLCSHVM